MALSLVFQSPMCSYLGSYSRTDVKELLFVKLVPEMLSRPAKES